MFSRCVREKSKKVFEPPSALIHAKLVLRRGLMPAPFALAPPVVLRLEWPLLLLIPLLLSVAVVKSEPLSAWPQSLVASRL